MDFMGRRRERRREGVGYGEMREEKGVELCKQDFDVDALQVLDPTMLLVANDYNELFKKKQTPKSKGNLLNYVLDETDEIKNLIQKVASEKKMIPFAVNNHYIFLQNLPNPIDFQIFLLTYFQVVIQRTAVCSQLRKQTLLKLHCLQQTDCFQVRLPYCFPWR